MKGRNEEMNLTLFSYKPAANEQETDAELAELVEARQHECRITVTLDEL